MQFDSILCSYPKCGRTWLRFLLANYLSQAYELNLSIDYHTLFKIIPNLANDPQRGIQAFAFSSIKLPRLVASHQTTGQLPATKLIFLYRCPIDTLVSNFFQVKDRQQAFIGALIDYVHHPMGLANLCRFYNQCADDLAIRAERDRRSVLLLSYEQMHHDTTGSLLKALEFMGIELNETLAAEAVDRSAFSRMQELERSRGFPNDEINSDPDNVNSLRARVGKIGGYHEYLAANEIEEVTQQLSHQLTSKAKRLLSLGATEPPS